MHLTWVDLLFIGFFFYFAVKGWSQGLLYFLASIIAVAGSFFVALQYAHPFSSFLSQTFSLPNTWSGIIAFFLIAFAAEALLSEILNVILQRAPRIVTNNIINQFLGALVSVSTGLFFFTLLIVFLLFLPLKGTIKQDINSSLIVSKVLVFVEANSGQVPDLLQNSAKRLTKFMTIEPDSKECLALDAVVKAKNLHIDSISEEQMVRLVNTERAKVDAPELTVQNEIRDIARAYAQQMLLGRFFCHYDPAGHDVGYRLEQAHISYLVAGENLAYAPDLSSAHIGLMNSEGHRKNILNPQFHHVGIGVIDAGPWGKMFVQVFTD